MVEQLLNMRDKLSLKSKTLNEPSRQTKYSFKAIHLIFFYNQLAILAKMQGPGNVIFTTLKKKTIGYGQYLGAKDGFTLALADYPVGPART